MSHVDDGGAELAVEFHEKLQRVPGFGKDLGVLDADHLELLGQKAKSNKDSQVFIRALLAEVLR